MRPELKMQIEELIEKYNLKASVNVWPNGSSYFMIKVNNQMIRFDLNDVRTLEDFEKKLETETGLIRLRR